MADNPVGLSDLEAAWRPLSDQESTNAVARLAQAWARLLVAAPSVSADLDSGALSADLVSSVIVDAVLRVLRNPEGLRQEAIDDYSWTRDATGSAGTVYFTRDELRLLGVRRGAATMTVSRSY